MNTLLRDVRSPGWSTAGTSSAIAIFLHGFGSNERDLTGLAPALELTMPWAALRAPIELGNGGAAWFTITTPGNPDPGPVAEATDAIWAWVDAEVGPGIRVVPIGFSQGGLMASQLLRTRVDVALERQNGALLESMDRRARLQLRLQQTVEGLSVAAITYYVVGLVGYVAKGAKAAHVPVEPDVAVAVAIPVVAVTVWFLIHRVRRHFSA